jgi:predicted transcriptional regulator
MNDEQLVIDTLARLPETASLDEIQEELKLIAGLKKGEKDIQDGNVVSHDEVKNMLDTWTSN